MRLESLPPDILLEIAADLSPRDVLHLRWTCRVLRDFTQTRALWITQAQNILRRRPLPIPAYRSFGSLALPELIEAASRADRLQRNWNSENPHIIGMPSVFHVPELHIKWIGSISGTRNLFILFDRGLLSWWDLNLGARMGLYDTNMNVSYLDFQVIEEGREIVLAMGMDTASETQGTLHVVHMALSDATSPAIFTFIVERRVFAPVITIFIKDRYAALVISLEATGTYGFFLLQWRESLGGVIDTGLPRARCDIEVSTTSTHLTLYWEDQQGIHLHRYRFEDFDPYMSENHQTLWHLPPTESCVSFYEPAPQRDLGAPVSMLVLSRSWRRPNVNVKTTRWDDQVGVLAIRNDTFDDDGNETTTISHHVLDFMSNRRQIPPPLVHTFLGSYARGEAGPALLTVGPTGSNAVWVVSDLNERRYLSFVSLGREEPYQRCPIASKRLDLPGNLDLNKAEALDLDDASGVLAIATSDGKLYLYNFA